MSWYLGPTGALVQIPAPEVGLEVTPQLVGAIHRSVGGAQTVAVLAQPRIWPMKWPALTEDQTTYLRMVGLNLVRGPLRLIDGEIRNRIGMRIASGGSATRTPDAFSQTGGLTQTWVQISDPPPGVPLRGAISWQRSSTGAGSLTISNALDRVPIVAGEQIRVSMWARSTASMQARAAVDAFDTSGTPTRTTGSLTALTTPAWTQLGVTYTPTSNQIEHAPVLDVPSGQAASTIQTTGWLLSAASAPTTWSVGGGAVIVAAGSALMDTYVLIGTHGFALTLLESRIS